MKAVGKRSLYILKTGGMFKLSLVDQPFKEHIGIDVGSKLAAIACISMETDVLTAAEEYGSSITHFDESLAELRDQVKRFPVNIGSTHWWIRGRPGIEWSPQYFTQTRRQDLYRAT